MQNVYMGLDVEDFIFGEGTTYEESFSNVTDEEMNEFGVIECTEDPDVACYKIALENEQNYNAIMMAMLTQEYNVLESTGSVMVYEASTLKNFYENVKKQIQRFWAKVKGVFKKVMDKLSSIVLSNKAFVKKYRTAGLKMPEKEKEFTGYMFPLKDIKYSAVVSVIEGIKGADKAEMDAKDKTDNALNEVRGKLIGSGSLTAEGFEKQLKLHLYGSENTEAIKIDNLNDLFNELESASDQKKAAKAAHKEAEKSIKGLLSEVKKEQSSAKSDAAVQRAKKKSEIITRSLNIMSTALSVQTRAIIANAVQNRKMANYIVNVQNKKGEKFQKESFVEDGLNVEII